MSLASVVRKGVALASKQTGSLQEAVEHVTWIGQDFMGAATVTSVPRKALVEQKLHQRRLSDGTMVTVKATLTFLDVVAPNGATGRVEPIDTRDTFILADGSSGPVVDVDGFRDPGAARPFFLQVYMGVSR
jgi:hypothetical protein